ncbi:unnamed protein product, partial [Symbiodinium sp. CCMP2592]
CVRDLLRGASVVQVPIHMKGDWQVQDGFCSRPQFSSRVLDALALNLLTIASLHTIILRPGGSIDWVYTNRTPDLASIQKARSAMEK